MSKRKRRLDILVPQYKETDEVIKPLLDSIAVQQNVEFEDIGVIIVNDGSDVRLSDELLESYPFEVEYYLNEHKGVSETRQEAFRHSTAEYVMFCDADDMFCSNIGLWFVFNEIERSHFDSLVSVFMEEGRHPITKDVMYIERGRLEQGGFDSTFVHGKVHKRKYLLTHKIEWNPNLTIHEDSFFNILCQNCSKNVVYCPFPFYLWKWRDESVCRHDPKYILKTFNNMLDSNTALIKEFNRRGMKDKGMFYVTAMIYDSYMTLNKEEWINQENQDYRMSVERRFKEYYKEFKSIYDEVPMDIKNQIYASQKNRFFQEGMFMESITLSDWLKHIEEDL